MTHHVSDLAAPVTEDAIDLDTSTARSGLSLALVAVLLQHRVPVLVHAPPLSVKKKETFKMLLPRCPWAYLLLKHAAP